MASLNATDANMPVALKSFVECANNPNEENQMATDDCEKASVEDDEHRVGNDTRIDEIIKKDTEQNASHADHKTMDNIASIKGMITSDQVSDEIPQHQSVRKCFDNY